MSESISNIEFAFRNYHYAIIHISWQLADEKKKTCVDTDCIITIIDRIFISATAEIKKITTKIFIRELRFKIHHFDEFFVLTFYMKEMLLDNTRAFAQITREIHIVDDLKTNMLIEADILTPKRMIINFATQNLSIDSCRNIIVFMNSRARSKPVKRTMKSSTRMILSPRITMFVFVVYVDELSIDRDLLFEPSYALSFDYIEKVYTHIVDASLKTVQIKNDIDLFVIIPRKARLNTLEEYEQNDFFSIEAHHSDLAVTEFRNWKFKLARDIITVTSTITAAVAMLDL